MPQEIIDLVARAGIPQVNFNSNENVISLIFNLLEITYNTGRNFTEYRRSLHDTYSKGTFFIRRRI